MAIRDLGQGRRGQCAQAWGERKQKLAPVSALEDRVGRGDEGLAGG